MEQQLTKYRTQLDRQANYNKNGLFRAQTEVYEEEIELSKNIDKEIAKDFTLKPLEIGFIKSLSLKDDPKFTSIQKTFQKYNQEIASLKANPQSGLHLKKIVMQSMLKFMRVMMLAPGYQSKKTILDLSYFWFIKHLNPKSIRKSGQELQNQIKQMVTQHQLLPKAIIEKELPSSKVAADLKEYKRRARTQHKGIDPPQDQLQNYQVHKVTYMGHNGEPNETEAQKWKRKLMEVKYDKPNLDQYYQEEEPQKDEKIEIPIVQPTDHIDPPFKQQGEEGAQLEEQAEIIPENSELAKQMQLLNQMGGEADEPQEAIIEEEDKKRGKLDPLVKVFMRKKMQQKQKIGNFEHPPINQLQRYRNNYKQAIQREDEQFSKCINDWAAKRSRFKTQIARKAQSIRINPHKTNTLASQSNFDHSFSQTRVNQALRDGRNYVRGEMNREKLNTEGGLSCFDRKRIKTMTASTNKTFSHILEENRRLNHKQDGLAQIERIKHKFAKNKIFTSMQAMKGGLMQHDQESEQRQKIQYPVCLLSNPFFVGKKKKKKKTKKRK